MEGRDHFEAVAILKAQVDHRIGRRAFRHGGKPFGDRALGLPTWTEDDVLTSVRDVLRLAEVRSALEKGRDPGEGWSAGFEAAAFGLLSRLARAAAS